MIYRLINSRFGTWGRRFALLSVLIWLFTLVCCVVAVLWRYKRDVGL